MKLLRELTGRFHERPHYELDELEEMCEQTAFRLGVGEQWNRKYS